MRKTKEILCVFRVIATSYIQTIKKKNFSFSLFLKIASHNINLYFKIFLSAGKIEIASANTTKRATFKYIESNIVHF